MDLERLVALYRRAKEHVLNAGYGEEVAWQGRIDLDDLTERSFLREAAWVVLSSGFRESVVRRHFRSLSVAFLEWESAEEIVAQQEECRENALGVFANRQKIDAIADIVSRVAKHGIEQIKAEIRRGGVTYLETLPFVGPITSYHLGKNLGLDVVKPDRHLVRMADASGHESAQEMCVRVARAVDDRIGVVDLVFWRYATLNTDYQAEFLVPGNDSEHGRV